MASKYGKKKGKKKGKTLSNVMIISKDFGFIFCCLKITFTKKKKLNNTNKKKKGK